MAGRLVRLGAARAAIRAEIAATPSTPKRSERRQEARRARTAYAAARMDGIADWALSAIQSADQELRGDLSLLRGHSRNHIRNDPFARNFVNLVALNVVGPAGFRMQSRVDTGNTDADLSLNQRIEDEWLGWAEDKDSVTADGRLDWWGLLTHVATTEPGDGEILIRMLPGFRDSAYGFALQVVDPDQLDHNLNRPPVVGTDGRWLQNAIRMGVEVNQWGRPVAYWIHPTHPTDTQQYAVRGYDPVRIPAEHVIHDYLPLRVGQTRGVPWMASVLRRGRLRDSFEEAAVVAARVGAAKVGFLQEEAPAAGDPNDDEDDGEPSEFYMDPEAGSWEILPHNIKPVEGWQPQYPHGEYGPFVQQALQAEAAGLMISYMTLTGDLKGTSFSSGRIGQLNERDTWRMGHQRKIRNICRPVMRGWTPWARLMGKLTAPENVFPVQRPPVRWQGRGWDWVSPKDDITAQALAADNILGSRTLALGERGLDFEDVARDVARENATLTRLGIAIPKAPAPKPDDERPVESEAEV